METYRAGHESDKAEERERVLPVDAAQSIGRLASRQDVTLTDGAVDAPEGVTSSTGQTDTSGLPRSTDSASRDDKKTVEITKQKNGKRGHPMKQVKRNLAQQGKLNAKKPMPPEQRRARRKKRKR